MSKAISVRISAGSRPLNARLLRAIIRSLLAELGRSHARSSRRNAPGIPIETSQLQEIESYELAISVVAAAEMAHLNETFLRHKGPTDVLAFNYGDPQNRGTLLGEVIVCRDEARRQAQRFRTRWQNELVRYVVHGTLHLLGYDDKNPVARRRMKFQENRLVRQLAVKFDFNLLE